MQRLNRLLAAGAAALVLGASSTAALAAPAALSCTQSRPCLRVQDVTVTEQNSGLHQAMFHITMEPAPIARTTVDYRTVSGTAKAGSDFVSKSGSVTFNKGQTRKTVIVSVKGDTIDESNEVFYFDLIRTNFGQIADGRGNGTIIDNDGSGGGSPLPPPPPTCPPSLPNCQPQ